MYTPKVELPGGTARLHHRWIAPSFLLRQIPAGLVPQVILLDLNMPLISGWDFLDLLKAHEVQLQGQCIVYLLTSSMAPADELRAQEYPLVAGLLHKPLDKRKIQLIRDHVLPAEKVD